MVPRKEASAIRARAWLAARTIGQDTRRASSSDADGEGEHDERIVDPGAGPWRRCADVGAAGGDVARTRRGHGRGRGDGPRLDPGDGGGTARGGAAALRARRRLDGRLRVA